MTYIIWRLIDNDQDLWLPIDCDTFEQAADAWLECVKAGERARITEDVPISLRDARHSTPPTKVKQKMPGQARRFHNGSAAEKVSKALRAAPDGLSRKQLADITGLFKTNVGTAVAGLMKRNLVRVEQRPPDADRGISGVGKETVAVYFWIGDP